MAVVRNGTGPVHIAWVESHGFDAICGRVLSGANVVVFPKGRPAVRIWKEWRHCKECERMDRMLRTRG